jgi:hypothetical protein
MIKDHIVKIQLDLTGRKILITPSVGDDFIVELEGEEATQVAKSYGLGPMGKTYARAKIDGDGLMALGDEVDTTTAITATAITAMKGQDDD